MTPVSEWDDPPLPYRVILAGNVAAQRARLRLRQGDLAARMRALGWHWWVQTISELEQGRRTIRADEILGLALALQTTVPALLALPPDTASVALPSGELVAASRVTANDGTVEWDGDQLKIRPR